MLTWIRPSLAALAISVAACGGGDAPPFTIANVPATDARFSTLNQARATEPGITQGALLANRPLLTQVLSHHVVPGRVLRAQLPVVSPITTLHGETFTVGATLAITDQVSRSVAITATDAFASNGVGQVIDRVILPRP
jgi:uncharacterized surface protein with fasciclin (FAS1) repeats